MHFLYYMRLVSWSAFVVAPLFYSFLSYIHHNNEPTTSDIEQQPQHMDALTSLTFSKIYPEGLYKTLEGYRDQCVQELKGQIESTIDAVKSMKHSDVTQLFTFAYRPKLETDNRKMDYIGIRIQFTEQDLLDYTIYTYSPEPKPEKIHTDSWDIMTLKRLVWGENEEGKGNQKSITEEKIESLRTGFMNELIRKGIIANVGDK